MKNILIATLAGCLATISVNAYKLTINVDPLEGMTFKAEYYKKTNAEYYTSADAVTLTLPGVIETDNITTKLNHANTIMIYITDNEQSSMRSLLINALDILKDTTKTVHCDMEALRKKRAARAEERKSDAPRMVPDITTNPCTIIDA